MDHVAQARLRHQVRLLALIAAALSLICVALALAWTREHRRAECWRFLAEDDEPPSLACAQIVGRTISK